ncbi:MAG: STT3 domain-containing protein [Promethearchaeota archaeon]
MSRFTNSIRNFRDRIRSSLTIKRRNLLFLMALGLVFFLAILIRLSPVIVDNYLIKAFDPWIQYYNANYLSEHSMYEYFTWHDFKSWFPSGINRSSLRPGLTFTVVAIYNFFNAVGIPITLYDVCFYFPAVMGGITVLASYLLGKEVLDKKCGLLFAFFMAFNIGFMQRTTAGFFDNETIGVFGTIMTFYFFLKTMRTGRITDSILGGMFLGYLSLSWGGYNFVFYVLPIIVGIIVLAGKYNSKCLIAYGGTIGTGLLIFSLFTNFRYDELLTSLDIGGVFFFTLLLVIFHLIYKAKNERPNLYNGILTTIKLIIIPGIVILALLLWVAPDIIPLGLGNRLLSILSPLLREQIHIVASVAEHAPSAWSVFYYNTLIPLMLLPLGVFFALKRSSYADIFLVVFLLTIFYFTGSMIRIILLFAPVASLVAAYGLSNVLKIFGSFYDEKRVLSRKRKRQLKTTVGKFEIGLVYFIVGLMLFAQVSHAANIGTNDLAFSQLSPGGQFHDWEESLTWMKTNLPGDTVVVSWWDYGYWLTPIANVTSVNDNATINSTRIGLTGMAFTQTNELYSAKIFKRLKADYVLVYFGFLYTGLGGDEGKWPWMLRICNDNYEKYKAMGLEEDNWELNSVFDESKYWNATSQRAENLWFQSMIVQLMFAGIPTAPLTQEERNQVNDLEENYRDEINLRRVDDQGIPWVEHIPVDGNYNFDVFKPIYSSTWGTVKLFKLDYTALESSFSIVNPEVFDTGYATLKLENTGTKNLTITDVKINGQSYNYTLGKGISDNKVKANDEDLIWVDIKEGGTTFQKNDIVSITVQAGAVALEGKPYSFSNSTSNFFVKEAKEEEIQINRENSNVIQIDEAHADLYLEIENTGDNVVVLENFYYDTIDNEFINVDYLSGSSILEPGEKANVHISNSLASFFPVRTEHKIGVITPNGIKDEILMTSNYENYKISLLPGSRISSPEVAIIQGNDFRDHIPIDVSSTHSYTYDNGTTFLTIRIKNTGDLILGLDSIYLRETGAWTSVSSFTPFNINPGEEKYITVKASDYLDLDVNDEIGLIVTALFDGSTKTSDIGYLHTINDGSDIQIIESAQGSLGSYIAANETGRLLVKNTGDEDITLDEIKLNGTTILSFDSDVKFLSGDINLSMQECAYVSFNITGLNINNTDTVQVNVTTNSTASTSMNLTASVDPVLYNIRIEGSETSARDFSDVVITVYNDGDLDVNLDSVYINETFVGLSHFSEAMFNIGIGLSTQLTISMTTLETIIGTVNVGETLVILVITREGAEDLHEETVIS